MIRLPLRQSRTDILIQLMRWRMSGAYWGNQELHTMWEELLMDGFDVWFHVGEREDDSAQLFFFATTGKLCMQISIVRHADEVCADAEPCVPKRVGEILQRHGYHPTYAT